MSEEEFKYIFDTINNTQHLPQLTRSEQRSLNSHEFVVGEDGLLYCVDVPSLPRTPATRPWQIIGIDVVGPLPTTNKGNVYIVDCVCHFTRYVEGWAVPSIDMISIAKAVIERIVCRYGLFETLVSDRGSVFVGSLAAHIIRTVCLQYSLSHYPARSAPFPQSRL